MTASNREPFSVVFTGWNESTLGLVNFTLKRENKQTKKEYEHDYKNYANDRDNGNDWAQLSNLVVVVVVLLCLLPLSLPLPPPPPSARQLCWTFMNSKDCCNNNAWCIKQVYYITCPETTINFARFPATPTAKEVTLIEPATGTCVENAEEVGTPTYLCKGDGKWYLPTGSCKCKPGYQPDFNKKMCNVCPPGKYKHSTGDDKCQGCPEHSKAPDYGFSECRCNSGYYRAAKDPKDMPCTQPPSAPQNVTSYFVDQSTVILSWSPPQQQGGRNDTVYRVLCDGCGVSVSYIPNTLKN
ncbi:hypothetical protein RUM43_014486 [Polyplax serrata]|uniref:Fibronectin type-III domain-containing protein n=1 Tax=Polyplax serrata TaxID=468196 RepID=A0AAN8S2N9_POLSC